MSGINLPYVVTNVDGKDQSMDLITREMVMHRRIRFTGEVNDASADVVTAQLLYLKERSDEDIELWINSPGGSVTAGQAIRDVMDEVKKTCDICTVASGLSGSMAAVLLACGTKGKRFAAPSAEIMIHQPLGGAQGQATDIILIADHIQHTKMKLAAILAEACDKPVKTLMRDMERDNWKSAKEAMKYGLVDHIGFPDKNEEVMYE